MKSNGIYIFYVLIESRIQGLKPSPAAPTQHDLPKPPRVGLQAWDPHWGV